MLLTIYYLRGRCDLCVLSIWTDWQLFSKKADEFCFPHPLLQPFPYCYSNIHQICLSPEKEQLGPEELKFGLQVNAYFYYKLQVRALPSPLPHTETMYRTTNWQEIERIGECVNHSTPRACYQQNPDWKVCKQMTLLFQQKAVKER